MINVSVLYPNKPGARFDADYYVNVHMPLAIKLLGSILKGVSAEIGVDGPMPGQAPPFAAMCHFVCESQEAFIGAFLANAAELQGDIPNYTDIAPVIQVSEIRI